AVPPGQGHRPSVPAAWHEVQNRVGPGAGDMPPAAGKACGAQLGKGQEKKTEQWNFHGFGLVTSPLHGPARVNIKNSGTALSSLLSWGRFKLQLAPLQFSTSFKVGRSSTLRL